MEKPSSPSKAFAADLKDISKILNSSRGPDKVALEVVDALKTHLSYAQLETKFGLSDLELAQGVRHYWREEMEKGRAKSDRHLKSQEASEPQM